MPSYTWTYPLGPEGDRLASHIPRAEVALTLTLTLTLNPALTLTLTLTLTGKAPTPPMAAIFDRLRGFVLAYLQDARVQVHS